MINLPPLEHRPVDGDDFMPSGWCGACEHCVSWPVPLVCLACSYGEDGPKERPVEWPCAVDAQQNRDMQDSMNADGEL